MSVQTREIKPERDDCRIARSDYRLARDRFGRANRDLTETVAVMAASLTTVTAIQAVIHIAVDKLELPSDLPLGAFSVNLPLSVFCVYIGVIVLIFVLGFLRSVVAFLKRGRAERQMRRAMAQIFESCPEDLWPKAEG